MDRGSSRHDKLEVILQDQSAEPCDIPLHYLRDITNNFSDEREIGRGGFGVVYKGVLPNGAVVAVKNLVLKHQVQEKQFNDEVNNLIRVKHQNIVRYVGYCYETCMKHMEYNGKYIFAAEPRMLLCFEYIPNGSLDKYISEESCGLDWQKRYKIIKGICSGLHYLHKGFQNISSIIHLDLKPENILLDDNMVPKIADFGLSKVFDDKKTQTCTTTIRGTRGYMAPEYMIQGIITTKVDIYSFGVIMIEMISGRRKISPFDTGTTYSEFVELVLQNWRKRLEREQRHTSIEIDYHQIEVCLQIGLSCLKFEPRERPEIREIVERLNRSESSYFYASNKKEEGPPVEQSANGQECGGVTMKNTRSCPIANALQSFPKQNEDALQSPSSGPSELKKKQQEIIELWDACNISVVHRTYFFLLFKGDLADDWIYMETELRRLSFKRRTHAWGRSAASNAEPGSSNSATDASIKELQRERKTLARLMKKKLTVEERERMYTKWGVQLDSENRALQVARRLWTLTGDLEHARQSACLISKLVGF